MGLNMMSSYRGTKSSYVIGSEKTTLMAQNKKNEYFYVGLKLQVFSLFCRLFQAHSTFHCLVMGANAKRGSRTQNGDSSV